jgi:Arc/MetJ-type ribon-helix-helix transcriptional regulator
MAKAKVVVTLETTTLDRIDRLVQEARYPNRSRAIEAAIQAQLARLERRRLAEECAKLDPAEERLLAEEGLDTDLKACPPYRGG